MLALQNIIILASVILGSLAIPFVNNPTFSAVDSYDEALAPILNESDVSISEAKNYPGAVDRSFGPDKFAYSAETAFGMFSVEVSNSDMLIVKQKLTNAEATIERVVTNNGALNEKWELHTSAYTLASTKNFTTITETFSNPEGTCRKTEIMGTKNEGCSGQMYDMEDKWKAARNVLREYMKKMKNASEEIELLNIQNSEWNF